MAAVTHAQTESPRKSRAAISASTNAYICTIEEVELQDVHVRACSGVTNVGLRPHNTFESLCILEFDHTDTRTRASACLAPRRVRVCCSYTTVLGSVFGRRVHRTHAVPPRLSAYCIVVRRRDRYDGSSARIPLRTLSLAHTYVGRRDARFPPLPSVTRTDSIGSRDRHDGLAHRVETRPAAVLRRSAEHRHR